MAQYELIYLHHRARPFWLRVEEDTEFALVGIEVRQDGDEVTPRGKDEYGRRYTQRRHVLDKEAIRAREPGEMSPLYGELVTITEAAAEMNRRTRERNAAIKGQRRW